DQDQPMSASSSFRASGLALLVVISAGCTLGEVTAAEGGDVLVVEGHLKTARERQMVLLHRSLQDGSARPEPGALVTVTGPDGLPVRLVEAPLYQCAAVPNQPEVEESLLVDATCYATTQEDELRVREMETYELEVVSERGER